MKKIILIIATIVVGTIANAQKVKGKEAHKDGTQLDLKKDFDVGGKSILKKADKAANVKFAIHFKTITNESVYIGGGQDVTKASTWAVLDGISDETLQSITDEFAKSFQDKLKTVGISSLEWNKITASEKWSNVEEKQIDKVFQNKNEGLMEIYTANNGPHAKQVVGNPGIWGAYAKVGKDVGANPITMDIVVDFANFNMDMKRRGGYGYTKISADSKVLPQISIQASNNAPGFGLMSTNMTTVGKYGEATIITLKKNITFDDEYAVSVDSYQGKMPIRMIKKISWGSTMTTGSFLITANEQKYKEAVLKALDVYSDYIIDIVKDIKG